MNNEQTNKQPTSTFTNTPRINIEEFKKFKSNIKVQPNKEIKTDNQQGTKNDNTNIKTDS